MVDAGSAETAAATAVTAGAATAPAPPTDPTTPADRTTWVKENDNVELFYRKKKGKKPLYVLASWLFSRCLHHEAAAELPLFLIGVFF